MPGATKKINAKLACETCGTELSKEDEKKKREDGKVQELGICGSCVPKNKEAAKQVREMLKPSSDSKRGVIDVIGANYYLCSQDPAFINENPVILLTLFTDIINGKEFVRGNFGRGKTTTMEAVTTLMHGIPSSVVVASKVTGNKDLKKEQFVGQPDFADMHVGKNSIIWKKFTLMPQKIVDEFSLIPEQSQTLFLDGADRGNWEYNGVTLKARTGPFYALANWPYTGSSAIVPSIKDRLDVGVVVKPPNPFLEEAREEREHDETDLDDQYVSEKMTEALESCKTTWGTPVRPAYSGVMDRIDDLAEEFRQILESRFEISLPTKEQLARTAAYIKRIPVEQDATTLRMFMRSELFCPNCGEKTPSHPSCNDKDHYADAAKAAQKTDPNAGYAISHTQKAVSARPWISISRYSKALAWYQGVDKVGTGQVQLMATPALWHRFSSDDRQQMAGFTQSFMSHNATTANGTDVSLHLTNVLVGLIIGRYDKLAPKCKDMLRLIGEAGMAASQKDTKAKEKREKEIDDLAKSEDHPFFQHAKKFVRETTME